MLIETFTKLLREISGECSFGIPDSQLKSLCNYLMNEYGISQKHIIAANEGSCAALAAGYYLSTGKVPVVYLQNSGIGNIVNPVVSLLNDKVYGIPCVFIIGWRGEPGTKDEPQHVFQGEITLKLLEYIGIKTEVVSEKTTKDELFQKLKEFKLLLNSGKSIAFVVRKGALEYAGKGKYANKNTLSREDVIKQIVAVSGEGVVVSTTGKTSRELFEIRQANKQSHKYDFLTVGSMGHSSSIGFGIAINKPNTKIWCIDGDGAALMHLGAMAIIGANKPKNLIHIVINNGAHETVGGMPTVAEKIDFIQIASGCGYQQTCKVDNLEGLEKALQKAVNTNLLTFIEVKSSIVSRPDLGRPTTTPKENIKNFMNYLKECR
ncbi:MAG: phosphonopyruvate decarboxylase [Clostridiaceae bacterium]|nr:phosphonopyruvate decarboxylase [Clostridiaceae bacterium]